MTLYLVITLSFLCDSLGMTRNIGWGRIKVVSKSAKKVE